MENLSLGNPKVKSICVQIHILNILKAECHEALWVLRVGKTVKSTKCIHTEEELQRTHWFPCSSSEDGGGPEVSMVPMGVGLDVHLTGGHL